jgi:hypothetical protein
MTARAQLPPDRDMLAKFSAAMFKHAGAEGYVSLRAFYEDDSTKPFRITSTSMKGGLPFLIDVAEDDANRAANHPRKVVFCPPVAIFKDGDRARECDILAGLALSVECDQRPREAVSKLEEILGPATLVVRSGGVWIDPESGEVCDKLHLHWRLRIPARGADLATLKQARDLAGRLVGGDPSNKPVCHPIRWPGSWHRKGEPRLCEIETATEHEIDLAEALTALKKVAPAAAPGNGKANGQDAGPGTGWAELVSGIVTGSNYHGAEVQLASKMVTAGMAGGAVVNMLRGMMESSTAPKDARWQARYDDIPRSVATAQEKYGTTTSTPAAASPSASADPFDLWGKFEPPALPRGVLPGLIEDFAFDRARAMGADVAGIAASALVVCAAAIPDKVKLQVKRHDPSWLEEPRIWVFLVGLPSTKKSPIMRAATRPLKKINTEMARRYQEQKAKYDALSKEERAETEPPKRTQIILNDATIEAAQEVMKDSPDGVLCEQDELGGWFAAMDKYSGARGSDRGFWLQTWNGGPYSVQRISRGFVHIPNLSMCLLGGIQPEPIRKIMSDSVDDGLVQRGAPIILKPAIKGRDEPESPAVFEYAQLISRLHRIEAIVLRFDEGAQAYREELEEEHISLQACEAVDPKLAAHIGKYDGLFARPCIIFHCIENAALGEVPRIISEDTARRTGTFLHRFLLQHALAFHVGMLGVSNDHDRLEAIAGYILAKRMDKITSREVKANIRCMRKASPKEVEEALVHLDGLGWVDKTPGPRPSSPVHWIVNPAVHVRFADKAKEEETRRANVREIMIRLGKGMA